MERAIGAHLVVCEEGGGHSGQVGLGHGHRLVSMTDVAEEMEMHSQPGK